MIFDQILIFGRNKHKHNDIFGVTCWCHELVVPSLIMSTFISVKLVWCMSICQVLLSGICLFNFSVSSCVCLILINEIYLVDRQVE